MENITSTQKNQMALKYGALTGLIYIAISTGVSMTVGNFVGFWAMKVLAYVLYFVILGVFAAQIRKANGGYIEFREIFGAFFIMVLIAGLITYIYSYVYIYLIDPHFMEKMKASTINFMEKYNTPESKIDETSQKMDAQMAEAKNFSIGYIVLGYFKFVIMDCLFGLLVSLIVKKTRPIFDNR